LFGAPHARTAKVGRSRRAHWIQAFPGDYSCRNLEARASPYTLEAWRVRKVEQVAIVARVARDMNSRALTGTAFQTHCATYPTLEQASPREGRSVFV